MLAKAMLGPLEVSLQGLGCLGLTGFYGRRFDRGLAAATLRQALKLGVTFFDTADQYASGANEELLGGLLRPHRADVVVATKFGLRGPTDNAPLTNSYVSEACDRSLRRLGLNHIDLYYCHRVDARVPIEETVGAMADLVVAGKVRFLGLSEVTAETLRRACVVHPIAALQSEWSLWSREIEGEVLGAARSHGIGIVAFAPLGRGFLTGSVMSERDFAPDDIRRDLPRFQGDNFRRNLTLVAILREIARERGCSPAQLALSWLHSRGSDVVPIPGADRPEFVLDNTSALAFPLREEEISALDNAFPRGAATGARYADMAHVAGETRPLTKSSGGDA